MNIDYDYIKLPNTPKWSEYPSLPEYYANLALYKYLWSRAGYVKRILSLFSRQQVPIRKVLPAVLSFKAVCPSCNKTWRPINTLSVNNAPGGWPNVRRFSCIFGVDDTCVAHALIHLTYKEYTNELVVKVSGHISTTDFYFRELTK